VKESVAA